MMELVIYKSEAGTEPFSNWFNAIRSQRAKQAILKSLNKIEKGLFGDVKPIGQGLSEYRIHIEKGYRIYFGNDGQKIIVLLVGSDKSNQSREIESAKNYWEDYKRQKRKENTK